MKLLLLFPLPLPVRPLIYTLTGIATPLRQCLPRTAEDVPEDLYLSTLSNTRTSVHTENSLCTYIHIRRLRIHKDRERGRGKYGKTRRGAYLGL